MLLSTCNQTLRKHNLISRTLNRKNQSIFKAKLERTLPDIKEDKKRYQSDFEGILMKQILQIFLGCLNTLK